MLFFQLIPSEWCHQLWTQWPNFSQHAGHDAPGMSLTAFQTQRARPDSNLSSLPYYNLTKLTIYKAQNKGHFLKCDGLLQKLSPKRFLRHQTSFTCNINCSKLFTVVAQVFTSIKPVTGKCFLGND